MDKKIIVGIIILVIVLASVGAFILLTQGSDEKNNSSFENSTSQLTENNTVKKFTIDDLKLIPPSGFKKASDFSSDNRVRFQNGDNKDTASRIDIYVEPNDADIENTREFHEEKGDSVLDVEINGLRGIKAIDSNNGMEIFHFVKNESMIEIYSYRTSLTDENIANLIG